MNPLKATMLAASAGMDTQSRRLTVTAENLSNADTPGYKRKILSAGEAGFSEAARRFDVTLDRSEGDLTFQPDHPMAAPDGYVEGSNVSLVVEMADMREASRSYDANLNAFQQARTMYGSLLDILRR